MSAPPFDSDHRPLPPDVDSHYNPHRGAWFYVHLRSNPPRISYIHPADEVAQNQQQASSQPQQTIYTQTSFPQQQARYQPQRQETNHTQTSFTQQQAGYQPQRQETIYTQTSFPQQQAGYQPQQPQTNHTQTSFPQQQLSYQPQQPQTNHTQTSFPQQPSYQPQQPQTIHTQTSFPQQQAGYQPQQPHTQSSLPQQQAGYQPQQPHKIHTQTSLPQQQAGYQPQQQQTIHTQTSFPQQQAGYQPQQQTIHIQTSLPQQQAGYQPQQQQTIHTQTFFPQHQQSYQAGNGMTPFARVFGQRPTKAQQLYSSVNHPNSSQSSPEDQPRHLFPISGPIQTSPQSLEFDPYSLYSSTSPRSSSSSTNPSTQVSPTSISPTIQPPEVHSSGYFFTRPRGRRPSISGTSMGSRPFTDEGGENFRAQSLFEPAPIRSDFMTPRVLEQPINIRPRHLRSATMPPVASVANNELLMGVFIKPKEVPVYSLTARPPSSIGFSRQTSQPTSSPQDLSSLPPGAAAPWMVGGVAINQPSVPVLAPTSPNDVMAQPVQNVVQKTLPLTPSQPQVHEQSKTNGKAATIGKAILKTTAKVALATVMPPGIANMTVNATAAGIENAIKAGKKSKAPEVQQPGLVGAGQSTTLAQSPLSPMYPTSPHQFYQQTQPFANSQLQQQRPIVVPQTQMPPQRQSSSLFNSIAGAATRAVVSSGMDAALNNTTEPGSNFLSFIAGDE